MKIYVILVFYNKYVLKNFYKKICIQKKIHLVIYLGVLDPF
jgi:hypothetical protein